MTKSQKYYSLNKSKVKEMQKEYFKKQKNKEYIAFCRYEDMQIKGKIREISKKLQISLKDIKECVKTGSEWEGWFFDEVING